MKRARADRLTGGTNDVNPQYFKQDLNQSPNVTVAPGGNATAFRVVRPNLPVNRINQSSSSTATIIEVLKVKWSYAYTVTTPPATADVPYEINIRGFLSTSDLAPGGSFAGDPSKGTVIDWFQARESFSPWFVAPGGITFSPRIQTGQEQPMWHDLTDGDGHGVLIATDRINVGFALDFDNEATAGQGNTVFESWSGLFEMLYRYKTVTLAEFIGIVQSQEGGA